VKNKETVFKYKIQAALLLSQRLVHSSHRNTVRPTNYMAC